ncbi:hypothetical protein CB1_000273064 [Camelus ferus]|nr:hypothetical protein CB1_000273064 [Camelus ferus]
MSVEMPYVIEFISSDSHALRQKSTSSAKALGPESVLARVPPGPLGAACMLVFQPDLSLALAERAGTSEVIICLDCSNSMEGTTFLQAKQIALHALSLVDEKQKINVVRFGTGYKELFSYPRHIAGSDTPTEFIMGLRSILLISDGHVQNESLTLQLVQRNVQHTRLFSCGVGPGSGSPSCHLRPNRAARPTSRFVQPTVDSHQEGSSRSYPADWQHWTQVPKSDPSAQIEDQMTRMRSPSCHSVSVRWQQLSTDAPEPLQAPAQVQSLFHSDRLLVYGLIPHCTQMIHRLVARALIRDHEDGVLHEDERTHEDGNESPSPDSPDILELIAQEDVDFLPYMSWQEEPRKASTSQGSISYQVSGSTSVKGGHVLIRSPPLIRGKRALEPLSSVSEWNEGLKLKLRIKRRKSSKLKVSKDSEVASLGPQPPEEPGTLSSECRGVERLLDLSQVESFKQTEIKPLFTKAIAQKMAVSSVFAAPGSSHLLVPAFAGCPPPCPPNSAPQSSLFGSPEDPQQLFVSYKDDEADEDLEWDSCADASHEQGFLRWMSPQSPVFKFLVGCPPPGAWFTPQPPGTEPRGAPCGPAGFRPELDSPLQQHRFPPPPRAPPPVPAAGFGCHHPALYSQSSPASLSTSYQRPGGLFALASQEPGAAPPSDSPPRAAQSEPLQRDFSRHESSSKTDIKKTQSSLMMMFKQVQSRAQSDRSSGDFATSFQAQKDEEGVKGRERLLDLVATFLVLHFLRSRLERQGGPSRSLMKLDDASVSRRIPWAFEEIRKASDAVHEDHPGSCFFSARNLGGSWPSREKRGSLAPAAILASRLRPGPSGRILYKVRWKGYTSDDDTWEPEVHLEDCKEVLLEFRKKVADNKAKSVKKDVQRLSLSNDIFEANSDSDEQSETKEETSPKKKKKKLRLREEKSPDEPRRRKAKTGRLRDRPRPDLEGSSEGTKKRILEAKEELKEPKKPKKDDTKETKELKKAKKGEIRDLKTKIREDSKENRRTKKEKCAESQLESELSAQSDSPLPEEDSEGLLSDGREEKPKVRGAKDKTGPDAAPEPGFEKQQDGSVSADEDDVKAKRRKKKLRNTEEPKESKKPENKNLFLEKKNIQKKPRNQDRGRGNAELEKQMPAPAQEKPRLSVEERGPGPAGSPGQEKETKRNEPKEKYQKKHDLDKEEKGRKEPKSLKAFKEIRNAFDLFKLTPEEKNDFPENNRKREEITPDCKVTEDHKPKENKQLLKERRNTRDETDTWAYIAAEGDQEALDSGGHADETSDGKQQIVSLGMDLQLEWMKLEDFQKHLDGEDEHFTASDTVPSNLLRDAVKNGDYITVKVALNSSEEYNLEQEDSSGMTLVMLAAAGGQDDLLRLLLRKGAKVNGRQRNGTTALIHAAEKNFLTTVAVLLEAGAFVNVQQSSGETALMKACKRGNSDIVRLVIECGADCNILSKHQNSALHFAKQCNNVLVYELLKSHLETVTRKAVPPGRKLLGHVAVFLVSPGGSAGPSNAQWYKGAAGLPVPSSLAADEVLGFGT